MADRSVLSYLAEDMAGCPTLTVVSCRLAWHGELSCHVGPALLSRYIWQGVLPCWSCHIVLHFMAGRTTTGVGMADHPVLLAGAGRAGTRGKRCGPTRRR